MPEITDNTGSSISGPITSAKEIKGCSGKVTTAIARERGGNFLQGLSCSKPPYLSLGTSLTYPQSVPRRTILQRKSAAEFVT
jgi:hypothetical protein